MKHIKSEEWEWEETGGLAWEFYLFKSSGEESSNAKSPITIINLKKGGNKVAKKKCAEPKTTTKKAEVKAACKPKK